MLIEAISHNANANDDFSEKVAIFLENFAGKCAQFRTVYQGYLNETVELGEITRAFSAATADAEMAFSEYSEHMTMAQLERFGKLQKAFDMMMENIFSEEIIRNYRICATAIENGEYFLIGLTAKGIQSSIYMLHSKDRIKLEQNRKLAALEQEQEQVQGMLKVIKALQQALEAELDIPALRRIEKVLGLYVSYFQALPRTQLLHGCDRRVLRLLKQHFETLLASGTGPLTYDHLSRCCKPLEELPAAEALEPLLSECRALACGGQAPKAA